jgi:hypothetical protein
MYFKRSNDISDGNKDLIRVFLKAELPFIKLNI